MTTETTTYRIAPSTNGDFDLAGPGNEFATYEEAHDAAMSMDLTNPIEGDDEWHIWECAPGRAPVCVTL